MKDKTVNLRPYHAEVKPSLVGCFDLTFFSNNADNTIRTKTVIRFEGWWLSYLAGLLWRVVKYQRKLLDESELALRGEP